MIRLASPTARRKFSRTAETQRSPLGFLMIASTIATFAVLSAAFAQSPPKGSITAGPGPAAGGC
ncbi:MAG: hypothetical protein G4V63_15910 [Candidatus Afipia apatlaquensis]|uniref:Uncharacterized protein n=1 Tax=Candidatus Afipia apatlaquensis TaxID=2712852 RepID=A0A7C9RGY8_9BRAD|nr:hypothetical protein [Candidatus Afipia apatlaquensis]